MHAFCTTHRHTSARGTPTRYVDAACAHYSACTRSLFAILFNCLRHQRQHPLVLDDTIRRSHNTGVTLHRNRLILTLQIIPSHISPIKPSGMALSILDDTLFSWRLEELPCMFQTSDEKLHICIHFRLIWSTQQAKI